MKRYKYLLLESYESQQDIYEIVDKLKHYVTEGIENTVAKWKTSRQYEDGMSDFMNQRYNCRVSVLNKNALDGFMFRFSVYEALKSIRIKNDTYNLFLEFFKSFGFLYIIYDTENFAREGFFTPRTKDITVKVSKDKWKPYKLEKDTGIILYHAKFEEVLIHELTHAYDYIVSKQKVFGATGSNEVLKTKGYDAYLQLPYEINARFYSALYSASKTKLVSIESSKAEKYQFDNYFDYIKDEISYRKLTKEQQQRVAKKVYTEFNTLKGKETECVLWFTCMTNVNNYIPYKNKLLTDYRINYSDFFKFFKQGFVDLVSKKVATHFFTDKDMFSNEGLYKHINDENKYESNLVKISLGNKAEYYSSLHTIFRNSTKDTKDQETLEFMCNKFNLKLDSIDKIKQNYNI